MIDRDLPQLERLSEDVAQGRMLYIHGDATDLRNSQQHLDGVIARALSKRGI